MITAKEAGGNSGKVLTPLVPRCCARELVQRGSRHGVAVYGMPRSTSFTRSKNLLVHRVRGAARLVNVYPQHTSFKWRKRIAVYSVLVEKEALCGIQRS